MQTHKHKKSQRVEDAFLLGSLIKKHEMRTKERQPDPDFVQKIMKDGWRSLVGKKAIRDRKPVRGEYNGFG